MVAISCQSYGRVQTVDWCSHRCPPSLWHCVQYQPAKARPDSLGRWRPIGQPPRRVVKPIANSQGSGIGPLGTAVGGPRTSAIGSAWRAVKGELGRRSRKRLPAGHKQDTWTAPSVIPSVSTPSATRAELSDQGRRLMSSHCRSGCTVSRSSPLTSTPFIGRSETFNHHAILPRAFNQRAQIQCEPGEEGLIGLFTGEAFRTPPFCGCSVGLVWSGGTSAPPEARQSRVSVQRTQQTASNWPVRDPLAK